MAEKLELELEVVTPDRLVVQEKVDIVMATGALGEFGILPNHIPFLTTLQPGELRYRKDNQLEYLAVTGGFAEVSDNKVTILAEAAERAREIDIDRATRARERAEKRLAIARTEAIDFLRAESALKRSLLRLRIAEKGR
ncbi:MAG: ATP synthase F1 subunit epsilon [Deltaproteobacteria bacterium RBG_13_43_22]|nr:MAG: ATP synthase F1 subunit epsilon [Deltaproteobacteria bacterium RBG_13_43_22]